MIQQMLTTAAPSAAPSSSPGEKKSTTDTAGPAFGTVLQRHLDDRVGTPTPRGDDQPLGGAGVDDADLSATNEATSAASDADSESLGAADTSDASDSSDTTDTSDVAADTGAAHRHVAAAADQVVSSAAATAARVANTPATTSGPERVVADSDPARILVERPAPAGASSTASTPSASTPSASTPSASTPSVSGDAASIDAPAATIVPQHAAVVTTAAAIVPPPQASGTTGRPTLDATHTAPQGASSPAAAQPSLEPRVMSAPEGVDDPARPAVISGPAVANLDTATDHTESVTTQSLRHPGGAERPAPATFDALRAAPGAPMPTMTAPTSAPSSDATSEVAPVTASTNMLAAGTVAAGTIAAGAPIVSGQNSSSGSVSGSMAPIEAALVATTDATSGSTSGTTRDAASDAAPPAPVVAPQTIAQPPTETPGADALVAADGATTVDPPAPDDGSPSEGTVLGEASTDEARGTIERNPGREPDRRERERGTDRRDAPTADRSARSGSISPLDGPGAASTPDRPATDHLTTVRAPTPAHADSSSTAMGSHASTAAARITPSPHVEATAPITATADQASMGGPNVLDRAALHRLAGVSRLGMDVATDELGAIRIDVADRRGVLEVNMRADEFPTRALLNERLHELRQDLRDSGIDVGSFDIAQGGTDRRDPSDAQRTAPGGDTDPALPPEDSIAPTALRAAIDQLTGAGRVDVRL